MTQHTIQISAQIGDIVWVADIEREFDGKKQIGYWVTYEKQEIIEIRYDGTRCSYVLYMGYEGWIESLEEDQLDNARNWQDAVAHFRKEMKNNYPNDVDYKYLGAKEVTRDRTWR